MLGDITGLVAKPSPLQPKGKPEAKQGPDYGSYERKQRKSYERDISYKSVSRDPYSHSYEKYDRTYEAKPAYKGYRSKVNKDYGYFANSYEDKSAIDSQEKGYRSKGYHSNVNSYETKPSSVPYTYARPSYHPKPDVFVYRTKLTYDLKPKPVYDAEANYEAPSNEYAQKGYSFEASSYMKPGSYNSKQTYQPKPSIFKPKHSKYARSRHYTRKPNSYEAKPAYGFSESRYNHENKPLSYQGKRSSYSPDNVYDHQSYKPTYSSNYRSKHDNEKQRTYAHNPNPQYEKYEPNPKHDERSSYERIRYEAIPRHDYKPSYNSRPNYAPKPNYGSGPKYDPQLKYESNNGYGVRTPSNQAQPYLNGAEEHMQRNTFQGHQSDKYRGSQESYYPDVPRFGFGSDGQEKRKEDSYRYQNVYPSVFAKDDD